MWCVGEGLCPSRGRPQGSPLRRGYKECDEVRNPPVTASPCQPPLGKGTKEAGDADCHSQFANWLRNDMVFCKESVQGRRADVGVRPYGIILVLFTRKIYISGAGAKEEYL